jgi:hypothetical protein
MTGVEILATQEVATVFGMNWNALLVTVVPSGLFGAFLFGVCLIELWNWWQRVLFGFGIGLVISLLVGGAAFQNDRTLVYETQYKVTISDEVQMNDFLERYEIIDTEGKIYTVRERD